MIFYGVVVDELEEAIELIRDRREAERVVENWDRDEPDRAGELHVELIQFYKAVRGRAQTGVPRGAGEPQPGLRPSFGRGGRHARSARPFDYARPHEVST